VAFLYYKEGITTDVQLRYQFLIIVILFGANSNEQVHRDSIDVFFEPIGGLLRSCSRSWK